MQEQNWVVLLRGINVGGKNKLPMAEFRALLGRVGCRRAQTYIQSGNAVVATPLDDRIEIETAICDALLADYSLEVTVIAIKADDFRARVEANPYPVDTEAGNQVHLYFLHEPAGSPDLSKIDALKKASEDIKLTDAVFYLHAPDGVARSKLAQRAEHCLGVTATARNLRTCRKLVDLLDAED